MKKRGKEKLVSEIPPVVSTVISHYFDKKRHLL